MLDSMSMSARAAVLVLIVLAAGCSGGDMADPAATRPSVTTERATTAITTIVEEPALTHREFIRELDRTCRKGNQQAERRFGDELEAASAANDYDRIADVLHESRSLNKPFYRAVRELAREVPEEDEAGLRRYLSLSRQLDVYYVRLERAYRQADDAELGRISALVEQTRSQRTRVTARMGLRECGS
jgi:hypothetical protein